LIAAALTNNIVGITLLSSHADRLPVTMPEWVTGPLTKKVQFNAGRS
jgi:hypothetical protein